MAGSGFYSKQDPAVKLEMMLIAGEDLEAVAAEMFAEFGFQQAADAFAITAISSPITGIRLLSYLASFGVSVPSIAHRLEALNISPWSLVACDRVSVPARLKIAEALGGELTPAVSEHGLRIVDWDIEELEAGLIVDGCLSIYRNHSIRSTPDRLFVEKACDVWDCPNLSQIGEQTTIKKVLRIHECAITGWPVEANIAQVDMDGELLGPFVRTLARRKRR